MSINPDEILTSACCLESRFCLGIIRNIFLSLQISFRLWRRMMFAFWLTVIIFSMIILILIYTYQFDHFPEYWEEYFHISPKQ